ncbi:hypothetical protein E3T54_03140 [Cryobacterium sp. Sr8]|uniref:hypothetical protein n=1 Tax=Cryobacterium sp. Sr8 TaxID=1259203 RepID=UPI00106CEFBB|nr:hypothetical protein [Cryobacterium sp. Sr8]TFD80568.1 hypothetical protein E3T54_03140 [Cryobacterium sp. Sr8]
MAITTHVTNAHTRMIKLDIREITRRLNGTLGGTLVASLSGSKDAKLPYRWAKADGPAPKNEAMRRLQFAYEQWTMLAAAEGEHVARAWFIGANPWLGYDTPVTAIREDRFKDVATAAQAVIDDSFSG